MRWHVVDSEPGRERAEEVGEGQHMSGHAGGLGEIQLVIIIIIKQRRERRSPMEIHAGAKTAVGAVNALLRKEPETSLQR